MTDQYENIKQKYHLADIVKINPFNYQIDAKKSSSSWIKFKGPSGDNILVKNTKSAYDSFYINTDQDNDKGDLWKFVASRLANTVPSNLTKEEKNEGLNFLKKIDNIEVLDIVKKNNDKRTAYTEKKKQLAEAYFNKGNTIPMTDYYFLNKKRGIAMEILKDPRISPTLYNTIVQQENGKIWRNTAFAKLDKNGDFQSLEVRNTNLKRIYLNHNVPWNSISTNKPEVVIIGESAIDVISYFELHHQQLKDKSLLMISTGGTIYDTKLDEISKLLDEKECWLDTKFLAITDNDKNGLDYDLTFATFLLNKYQVPTVLEQTNEFFNILKFDRDKLAEGAHNNLKELTDHFNSQMDKKGSGKYGNYIVLNENDDTNTINLHLPKSINSTQKIFNDLMDSFNNNRVLYIHKTKTDWNDTLQIRKGLKVNPPQLAPETKKKIKI